MATVTVRGEAIVQGTPDEVVVAISLSATRDRPELAYDEVAGQRDTLEALFDELEIDPAARSTAGVAVDKHQEYAEHGALVDRGYRASTRVLVRVAEAALVSRLLREAVTRSQAHVSGPWWRIADDNPARTEARQKAAADARRRAETYADALGARLGPIVAATEPGAQAPQVVRGQALFARRAPEEIPVDPGELDVRAALDVTFELEQP
jgi:uncharacterized protein YggE